MELITTAQGATMSSVLLVEIINEYRKVEGNFTILRHIDFMLKIEKELDNDCEKFHSEYKASNNQIYKCYELPKDECLLMLMSESRTVRKGVLKRLNELETPKTFSQALLLAAKQQEKIEQQQLMLIEANTKLDNLREWVSIIKVSGYNRVKETTFDWRVLKNKSKELDLPIKRAESPRFGYQNLYHINVFKACYPKYEYDFAF